MKVSPHFIITTILPLLIVLFSHETSAYERSAPPHDDSNSSLDPGIESCSKMTSYEGKCVLVEAEVLENNTKVSLPAKDDIVFIFGIEMGISDYSLGIKAANQIGTSFNVTGQTDDCYDEIEVGVVITTLMWPPEEFLPIENFLTSNLESMTLMKSYKREDDTMLVMQGDNAKMICKYIKPPHTEYKGKWKINTATDNQTAIILPDDDDIIIEFTPDKENPSGYDWYAKASNRFWTKVDIIDADDEFDIIEVGPYVASTKMIPDKKHVAIEKFFKTALEGMGKLKKYEEDGDEMLVMKGNNSEMRCERFVHTAYKGKWKITTATDNQTAIILPDDDDIIIEFSPNKENPSGYDWYAKASNRFWTKVDIIDADDEFDLIKVGPYVASTRMMPDKKHEAIERFFTTALVDMDKLKKYEDDDDEMLVMKGKNSEMRCERFVPTPRVYTGKWELTRAVLGGDDVIYPVDAKIEISFEAAPETSSYTIVTKVANTMRTSVDVLDRDDDGYDDIKVGKVASTRMAVPEKFQDIEYFFWKLEVMEKMKSYMEECRKLVMFGDGVELYADWINEE